MQWSISAHFNRRSLRALSSGSRARSRRRRVDTFRARLIGLIFSGLLLLAPAVGLADDSLPSLAAALQPLRTTDGVNKQRDAGPELTPVKHLLRAWMEQQLPVTSWPPSTEQPVTLPSPTDFSRLSDRLNRVLSQAGLTCPTDGPQQRACTKDRDDDARGYLGTVSISSLDDDRYLLVTTAVGVRCGYDESAYIYARGPKGEWRLLFESEQDRYGDKEYAPQNFLSITVSPAEVSWTDPAPPPLVGAVGFSPWCSSNWQTLYARLWRATPSTPAPGPLLDRSESLYMGDDFVAGASLSKTDWLVEYEGGSVDAGVLVRKHVWHYLISPSNRLQRIAPVALSPGDFMDEWLTNDWAQASQWSDARADRVALARAYASAHGRLGEFDGPEKRCRSDPTLWQVTFAPDQDDKGHLGPDRYFLVRWLAPYRFSLVEARRAALPGCDETVAMPDNIGTFFASPGSVP